MRIASRLLALACFVPLASLAQGKVVKIGVMNDMSGLYADLSGQGSVVAAKLSSRRCSTRLAPSLTRSIATTVPSNALR